MRNAEDAIRAACLAAKTKQTTTTKNKRLKNQCNPSHLSLRSSVHPSAHRKHQCPTFAVLRAMGETTLGASEPSTGNKREQSLESNQKASLPTLAQAPKLLVKGEKKKVSIFEPQPREPKAKTTAPQIPLGWLGVGGAPQRGSRTREENEARGANRRPPFRTFNLALRKDDGLHGCFHARCW